MNRKSVFIVLAVLALPLFLIVRGFSRKTVNVSKAVPPPSEALSNLGASIRDVRESTSAAFALHVGDDEYARLDEAAKSEYAKLQAAFAASRSTMPEPLRAACEGFLDLASEAQLQLMAFAINRKNRAADSAQDEAEISDLVKFRSGVSGLSAQLAGAFDAVGVKM